MAGAIAFLFGAYPFFAITERTDAQVLVVEGWIDHYATRAAVKEFESGSYERAFTTGGPVQGMGGYTNDYNTSASVGATRLKQYGLPEAKLQMVPSRVMGRDRTYNAALALKTWADENKLPLKKINIVTVDVHARRTRLLFQKALGPGVEVGIIAVPNPDYDSARWWRYSQGVRSVLGECIGYVYARVLFHP